jgi:branched-chain amino acid transport system substrate-binding protein
MDANEFQQQYATGKRNFFQVNLSGANLSGINLSDANLDSADLTGANLSKANLSHVNLRLAKLSQADLRGTDLSEANLANADLREALYDEKTKFPDKFDPVVANLKLAPKTPTISPVIEVQTPDLPMLPISNPGSTIKNGLTLKRNLKIRKKYLIPVIAAILALVAVIVFANLLPQWLMKDKISPSNSPLRFNPRISSGDKVLIENEEGVSKSFKLLKQAGVKAIAEAKYNEAISYLDGAIQESRNSPESLIYLNNAKIGKKQAETIAVVAPIGSDPKGALEILRGVASAQHESNQQIGTTPIKVVIVNDDDKEEVAKQVASVLIQEPAVLGVVGHWASQVSLAAKDIYNSGKLVAISPISTAVTLSNSSSYFFRTVPSDSVAAKALADYMVTKLNKKQAAVFFNSQSTYSQSLKNEFIEALSQKGGEVSSDNTFDLSDPGFSAKRRVEQAIQQGAEVILLAPNTDSLYKALAVAQANDKRLPLLGGDDVYGERTLQNGGAATEGMVVAIAWHVYGTLTSADFRNQSIQLWGTAGVNWRTAMSYDAAKALITAIQRQSQPTRTGTQQVLSSTDFFTKGASGTIQFESSGDRRNPPLQLVKVVKAQPPRTYYYFAPVEIPVSGK